jgi:hypothetical protein
MEGDMEKQFGDWNKIIKRINDGIAGGPLILFNTYGDTLIISQMTEFMSTSMQYDRIKGSLNYGVMSGVDEIPPNYSAEFVIYYNRNGINKVIFKLLLLFY